MILLYEFHLLLTQKFFSLKNICETFNKTIVEMALSYIDCVDDENYLTAIMLEKDFYGIDVLKISVELELNELVKNAKVEAII